MLWEHKPHDLGRVGGTNNGKKVFWEFDSIIMQNASEILLLL